MGTERENEELGIPISSKTGIDCSAFLFRVMGVIYCSEHAIIIIKRFFSRLDRELVKRTIFEGRECHAEIYKKILKKARPCAGDLGPCGRAKGRKRKDPHH
jgi:hypothetical protein